MHHNVIPSDTSGARESVPPAPEDKPKTLRDEFAMAALTGFLSTEAMFPATVKAAQEAKCTSEAFLAAAAYGMADAMLAERKK